MTWKRSLRAFRSTPPTCRRPDRHMQPDLQFADGVLARIHACGGKRYDERAYLFVLGAIEYLQSKFDMRRHVTGAEVAWACRDLAFERFGLLSQTVFDCWGVRSSADLGHIVFTLVEIDLLSTQPGDKA